MRSLLIALTVGFVVGTAMVYKRTSAGQGMLRRKRQPVRQHEEERWEGEGGQPTQPVYPGEHVANNFQAQ
ncbi:MULTISPECIES: hypothetical protein [Gulbenkiania]|uniref:Uncharacterized protein n=2 Tax=Gulbenkiania TaxID=397456 RepID=A0A0K6GUC0_9NEIS|nr:MULTISPECIES: hypothetical protein [Gulbenkiania]TCW33833.1 hypothetical protein EV669_101370 [Gulbenkiania mobilis]CUA82203.1 hypothetical protein Ga0061063_1068 [Gulbenkiania indica]